MRATPAQLSAVPIGIKTCVALWAAPRELVTALSRTQMEAALAQLVAKNLHSQALLAKCQWCAQPEQVIEAARILAEHMRQGCLSAELEARRQRLEQAISAAWISQQPYGQDARTASSMHAAVQILAQFQTRTGKDAITVKRHDIGKACTYSYNGTLGAGSGGNLSELKQRVMSHVGRSRYVRQVATSDEFAAA